MSFWANVLVVLGVPFEVCTAPCSHSIAIRDGIIDVFAGATTTIHADVFTAGDVPVRKRNQGTLVLNGESPSVYVADGELAGSASVNGDLRIGPRGNLAPGTADSAAEVTVSGQVIIDGTLRIDVGATSDKLAADDLADFG